MALRALSRLILGWLNLTTLTGTISRLPGVSTNRVNKTNGQAGFIPGRIIFTLIRLMKIMIQYVEAMEQDGAYSP